MTSWQALLTGRKNFATILRETLKEAGLDKQYDEAFFQRIASMLPEDVLERERIPEDIAAKAYARFRNLPYHPLVDVVPKPEALKKYSEATITMYQFLPFDFTDDGKVMVAVSKIDPVIREALNRGGNHNYQPVIAPKSQIEKLIQVYVVRKQKELLLRKQKSQAEQVPTSEEEDDASVIKDYFAGIVKEAVLDKASDIHIEPAKDGTLAIRFRVDGKLQFRNAVDPTIAPNLITNIKLSAQMNIAERRVPQDGRITLNDPPITLRVSSGPTVYGEMIVIRILPREQDVPNLENLGFGEFNFLMYERAIKSPNGIVLVTGPTGSGKSTTLAASIKHIASPQKKVMSIEDPVEYPIPGVIQHQVNEEAGYTFARALRAFLRQDPDVIYVGEIRDAETAKIAVQAALTGHLVFGTLHTNDAPSAVPRLLQMEVEAYNLAPTLRGVLAQRLVRKVCPRCARPASPKETELVLKKAEAAGVVPPPNLNLQRGEGCPECRSTGYKGRTAIHEFMWITPEIEEAISRGAPTAEIRRLAIAAGMKTLYQDGLEKVFAGITTLEEIEEQAISGETEAP